jgi:hypothetical protein
MKPKTLVILESPFGGEHIELNRRYRDACLRDSARRNEAPVASHKMFDGVLDDNAPRERQCGIECGFAWWEAAAKIVFYIDLGYSPGMLAACERAEIANKPIETRMLPDWVS